MNGRTYLSRFKRHLKHACEYISKGDYIQFSEKLWGAVTALNNYYYLNRYGRETVSIDEKKKAFVDLFREMSIYDKTLLSDIDLITITGKPEDVFDLLLGLHRYFYGAYDLPSPNIHHIFERLLSMLSKIGRLTQRFL